MWKLHQLINNQRINIVKQTNFKRGRICLAQQTNQLIMADQRAVRISVVSLEKELTEKALEQLTLAVNQCESWAIQEVLKRTHPSLKPITPEDSLDGDMLMLKMKEIQELEQRLIALEAHNNG
jgi:hypothetical protein